MPELKNNILLDVQDLRVHFQGDETVSRAVDGVSYKIHRRETVCIVGESGCGKTVTALAMLGLLPSPPARIAGGRALFDGRDLLTLNEEALQSIRGRKIAMVFQEPMTSLNPVFTIGDQISEAIRTHNRLTPEALRERCVQLLTDVGLTHADRRTGDYPHQLSGGQRQRVMIAMALACEPDLVIADEPTTALDVTVQAQILRLLRDLKEEHHMAIQYITHDLSVVSAIADRVYVMYAGMVVEEATAADLFTDPRHPYTQALLAALPTREKRGQRLYTIAGNVPHPAYKPAGCPFHPRCGWRIASCETDLPDMRAYDNGHLARCPVIDNPQKDS
jgi:oligopeptide/dipeptide ABC transporter ATP-binding protein